MNSQRKYLGWLAIILLCLSGCNKDENGVNSSPENPPEPPPIENHAVLRWYPSMIDIQQDTVYQGGVAGTVILNREAGDFWYTGAIANYCSQSTGSIVALNVRIHLSYWYFYDPTNAWLIGSMDFIVSDSLVPYGIPEYFESEHIDATWSSEGNVSSYYFIWDE